MKDLIKALQILLPYANDDRYPTHCEHDTLYFGCGIERSMVSDGDTKLLDDLGVFWGEEEDGFISFRFGSC